MKFYYEHAWFLGLASSPSLPSSLTRSHYIKQFGNHSALKGITTLTLFVYKYVADTSFVFLSCVDTDFGFVSAHLCVGGRKGEKFFVWVMVVRGGRSTCTVHVRADVWMWRIRLLPHPYLATVVMCEDETLGGSGAGGQVGGWVGVRLLLASSMWLVLECSPVFFFSLHVNEQK